MGTIPILEEKKKDFNGLSYDIQIFTTTGDVAEPEFGAVWFHAECEDLSEYSLTFCAADYDDRWLNEFVRAFLKNPDFRKQFECAERSERKPKHSFKIVKLKDCDVEIDEAIADAVLKLNESGYETKFCCQGGDGSVPYVSFATKNVPAELAKAWNGAGYLLRLDAVHAIAPFGVDSSKQFIASLNDWMNGTLEPTGKRYAVTEHRPNSLPKLPEKPKESTESQLDRKIRKLVKKGSKAKFSDYVALKSGRDRFSSMNEEALKALCSENDVATIESTENSAARLSALRWTLRGLPPNMAIRKAKTDMELAKNIQTSRSKRANS